MCAEDSTRTLKRGNVLSFVQGDHAIVNVGGAANSGKAVPFLSLLFAVGARPVRGKVLRAVGAADRLAVSIDSASRSNGDADDLLEIVCDGMTFAIRGMAVEDDDAPAAKGGRSMSPSGSDELYDAITIVAGRHTAGGAFSIPILRGQTRAATLLGRELEGLEGFSWSAAGNIVDCARYTAMVGDWHRGGAFPVEAFVCFKPDIDGGLATRGLALLTGQELRLEPEVVEAVPDHGRLAARIAEHLVPMGRLSHAQDFASPDGRTVRLEPSRNGRYVRAFLR